MQRSTGTQWLSGDTCQNCPSQTTTPPSHPLPVTVSMTISVCHTLCHILHHNSISTLYIPPHCRQLHPCWMIVSPLLSLWLSMTISMTFHDKLCHGLRHVLYHSIVLPLSLFFYIYNLTLILAEVLSYSVRTSCQIWLSSTWQLPFTVMWRPDRIYCVIMDAIPSHEAFTTAFHVGCLCIWL